MAKLNKKKVEKIIKQKRFGLSASLIARQLKISKRRINQIYQIYLEEGSFELKQPGKPKTRFLTKKEESLILRLAKKQRAGARLIASILREKYNLKVGNNIVHELLLDRNMAVLNKNKQKRRKPWIRYERKYSLSAGHMDWHTAKWQENTQVCIVLDDSSRKILAAVECSNATEEESIKLVKQVIEEYKHIRKIREIITDHGTQFCANKKDKNNISVHGFGKFLEENGIKHILCRYKHPQSNGKAEKWFDAYERHRRHFSSFNEFIAWYNTIRVHESLDLRTPENVFWERLQPFLWGMADKFFKEVKP